MDLEIENQCNSKEETTLCPSSEPIYYLHHEDLQWWDDDVSSVVPNPQEEWVHPPRFPPTRQNIHRLNDTHIRSPFVHRWRPHRYKNDVYDKYNASETADGKEGELEGRNELKEEHQPKKKEQARVNIELSPLLKKETAAKPKKSLRQRLRDGEVVFYEDYIEREIARDYCRLFGEPFDVPRHDWGGGDFFFGEYALSNPPKEADPVEKEEETEQPLVEEVEDPVKHHQVDALIMADTTLDPKKRQELLDGELRHPKDRVVRYHHLRTYACMIDSVTKCPLIHVELQSALKKGWSREEESIKLQAKQRSTDAYKDPYEVKPEHIARANEILASRSKTNTEASPKMSFLVSRRRGMNKEALQVGGGRYQL